MLAFALYILLDYLSHDRNIYKLLFLVPILMSTVLMTSWVSHWSARFFFIYRSALIAICFVVAFLYFRDILVRKKKHTAKLETQREMAAKQKKAQIQKQRQNQNKGKGKKK